MKNHPELITIRDFIRYATSCFNEMGLYFGHGTDNAWDEAIALVLHTLHLPHDISPTILDSRLTEEERRKLFHLIAERAEKRIPVAYLTHQAWFAGLPFYVDERVLIPRSSISEIIKKGFQPWIDLYQIHDILDLCTGSGCIAIACAKFFADARIDASDISHDALSVAKINILRHEVENQVNTYESDLFNNLPKKQYDIIVTNPPYVSTEEMDLLPQEFQYEPALGLEAGTHGLDFVIRILREAGSYLKPHGILVVEVGNSEATLIEKYPTVPFTWIEFENSEGGVFVLTAEQLREHQAVFDK